MQENKEQDIHICTWTSDGGCRQPTIHGKAYCETHYERMYLLVLPEMADYIIAKELNSKHQNTD